MSDFNALLKQRAADVTPPPVLPAGTWLTIVGESKFGKSRQQQTDFVEFEHIIQSPGGDIEPEALEGVDYQGKKVKSTFYLTENALYRLADFIKVVFPDSEMSLEEGIQAMKGQAVNVNISHRLGDPDGQGKQPVYIDIKGYSAA